jgi:hypothetical protein
MEDATALCTQCGLCCSGLLFTYAELVPGEEEWAKRRGLPLVPNKGLSLPCGVLAGTRCGDFANRPRICEAFRCKLLRALDAGDVPLEDALALVERARSLARRVFPNGRRSLEGESVPVLLDAAELEAVLRRHFREPE